MPDLDGIYSVANHPLNLDLTTHLPATFQPMHDHDVGPLPGFPIGNNATARDVMALMDGLAFKIYPKGYWEVKWLTSSCNLAIFLVVAMAMRFYRSRKNPVPLWLFKLEKRPIPVKKIDDSKQSKLSLAQKLRGTVFKVLRLRSSAENKDTEKNIDTDGQEVEGSSGVRMGTFITASCVNCHLVLTSSYVFLLFVTVLEMYKSRDPSSTPPLIDYCFLDVFMHLALFSVAYFTALGYIAILLPAVPPWLWNTGIISCWVTTAAVGMFSITNISVHLSEIANNRNMIFTLLTVEAEQNGIANFLDQPADQTIVHIARATYKVALELVFWETLTYRLVAIAGLLLSGSYLIILITLTRKVLVELVQLRNAPTERAVAATKPAATAIPTWPSAAVPFSMPYVPGQKSGEVCTTPPSALHPLRNSLTFRSAARTPPPTPAPSGPLPLPPADAAITSSTPTSRGSEKPAPHRPASYSGKSPTYSIQGHESNEFNNANGTWVRLRKRESMNSLASVSAFAAAKKQDQEQGRSSLEEVWGFYQQSVKEENHGASTSQSELELGPRTCLDSSPTPWAFSSLQDDLASNEGYVAVCRFLFNCIIDHVAVMLQCLAFGCESIFLVKMHEKMYPAHAGDASLQKARIDMVFSCSFTVLYVINSLNLFAPFLLFPASQVKLATMLANLASPNSKASVRWAKRKRAAPEGVKGKESKRELRKDDGKVTSESYSQACVYPPSTPPAWLSAKRQQWEHPEAGRDNAKKPVGNIAGVVKKLTRNAPDAGGESSSSVRASESEPTRPQPTPPAATGARQMVLDSLISSHALPIQGFYCQNVNQPRKQQPPPPPPPPPEVEAWVAMVDYDSVILASHSQPREELRTFSSQTNTDQSEVGMGEAAKRRRQRLRQQWRRNVDGQQQGGGVRNDSISSMSSTSILHPPLIIAQPPTPTGKTHSQGEEEEVEEEMKEEEEAVASIESETFGRSLNHI